MRQGATDFHTKPQENNLAREPLMILRAGMTEGLQEAAQVTWPPLGGDSAVFGSATLGVSVPLARSQRASRLSSLAV